jgi:hypothetical protein
MEHDTGQGAPHRVGGLEGVGDEFSAHVFSDRPPGDPP